jgi:hypothetical protein
MCDAQLLLAPTQAPPQLLMLGEVALRFHMPLWRLQDAFRRGLLPPPLKAGRYRVVPADQLPALRSALERAGCLRPT